MARRLITTDEDEQRLEVDLFVVEPVAVDLGVHEHAHQVVGRLGAPSRNHSRRVGLVLLRRSGRGEHHLHRGVAALRAHHGVGPVQQPVAVFRRDAEQVADHDHRQRRRDVAHEVALAALAHRVDDRVAGPSDSRFQRLDSARGEAAAHQLAAHVVRRVVHVDHHRQRRECPAGCHRCWRTGPDRVRLRRRRRTSRCPTTRWPRRGRPARARASMRTPRAGRRVRRRRTGRPSGRRRAARRSARSPAGPHGYFHYA